MEPVSDTQRKKPKCSNPSTEPGLQKGQRARTDPDKDDGADAEVVRRWKGDFREWEEGEGESAPSSEAPYQQPVFACGGNVSLFTFRSKETRLLRAENQHAFRPVTVPFYKTVSPFVACIYCFLLLQTPVMYDFI